jgi:hypothetical protein
MISRIWWVSLLLGSWEVDERQLADETVNADGACHPACSFIARWLGDTDKAHGDLGQESLG